MIIWLQLRWWYSAGWQWAWQRAITDRMRRYIEYFSIFTLIQTLFAPFKQTFTGQSGGSISDMFRGFVDRSISRVIGFLVRSVVLIAGLVCLLFVLITGFLFLAVWAVMPLSLPVSLFLIMTGAGL